MDNFQNQRVTTVRSINSPTKNGFSRKEMDRVPPVPPPKPKVVQPKICTPINNEHNENRDDDCVRQSILRGSRNPTGSSSRSPFGNEILNQNQLLFTKNDCWNIEPSEEDLMFSNFLFEKKSTQADTIFSGNSNFGCNSKKSGTSKSEEVGFPHGKDFNKNVESQFSQQRKSPLKFNSLQVEEKPPHVKSNDWKFENFRPAPASGFRGSFGERKRESEENDSEYLMPRLEKQSNQVVILAENNPVLLKDDIVRNCDVLEESVPQSGHTGNLLRYWEKVSPEKEAKRDDRKHNIVQSKVEEDRFPIQNLSTPAEVDSRGNRWKDTFEMRKSNCSEELNNEKILDDILQEFESFNKDILDMNVTADEEKNISEREKTNFDKNDDRTKIECALPNYESLPGEDAEEEEYRDIESPNKPPGQEESVYYELDTGEPPSQSQCLRNSGSFRESERQSVTLIGFRKLNEDEQDPERISNTFGSTPSSSSVEVPILKTACVISDNLGTSSDSDHADKKKNPSKQRCIVM